MPIMISPNLPANVVEIGKEITQSKIDEINAGTLATQSWVSGAGFISDAPIDDNTYARNNGAWVLMSSWTPGHDLNQDGYGIFNAYMACAGYSAIFGTLELTTGGITFPDATVQTTAAVAGVSSDKAIANAIAASTWYAYDTGSDWNRVTNTNQYIQAGYNPAIGVTDGTSFVTGLPAIISSLNGGAYWNISVNGIYSDFPVNQAIV